MRPRRLTPLMRCVCVGLDPSAFTHWCSVRGLYMWHGESWGEAFLSPLSCHHCKLTPGTRQHILRTFSNSQHLYERLQKGVPLTVYLFVCNSMPLYLSLQLAVFVFKMYGGIIILCNLLSHSSNLQVLSLKDPQGQKRDCVRYQHKW